MFDIYLENFLDNGQYVDNDVRKVLTIPSSDSTRMWMVSPSFKAEMGKAESFDFSVNPGSPYYNAFVQYKTLIRVVYDDTIICYARVTTVNTSGLLQVRAIHSEGIYSVLKDSQIEGKEEELQSKITATALFAGILSEHNSRISGDSWKTVSMGVIDSGLDSGEAKKQAPTSWSDSLSAIDSILGKHGGYTRVRYEYPSGNSGGHITSYLDWKKDFFRDAGANRPHIQVAKNLIDFSSSSEVSELFTRVIPIGQKSGTTKAKESRYIYLGGMYYPVTRICSDYSAEELNSGFHRYSDYANAERNYGIIYKTLNFANADNTSKLLSYTQDWVKKNYYGALRTFTVKAIDMHMLGDSDPKILVGDCVDFTYPEYDSNGRTVLITRKLVCKAVNYNLFNPDQSSYTLGIPSDLLDFEYGEKKKTKKSSSTAAAAAKPSGGGGSKPKVVDFGSVADYLDEYYRTKGWGSYENSIANHAYSWRVNNLEEWDHPDYKPAKTFTANKEYKLDNLHHETYTENDEFIINPAITSEYFYANFEGVGKAHILGHYKISSCAPFFKNNHPNLKDMEPQKKAELLEKIPRNERYGYEYGVAYVEGTCDIFAFSWNEYWRNRDNNAAVIPIKFYFAGYSGSSHGYESAGSTDELDSEQADDNPGTPVVEDSGSGKIKFFDKEGNPSAEIFPDYGSMKFSDAYDQEHWEYDDGTPANPGDEGAHPKPLYDDDGNRIWTIAINEPIQMLNPEWYEGATGIDKYVTFGGKGFIATNDISLPGIPSFQTEVAVIRDAIIQRATIGELRAYVAELGNYQDVDDVDITELLDEEHVYHYEFPPGTVVPKDTPGAVKVYDRDEHGNLIPLKDKDGKSVWKVKDGTRFKTAQDHIQGVTGRFTLNSDGSMDIIEGGGINIRRNNAQFGLWDKGELAAGIFAYRDPNDGSKITEVRGDKVWIGYNFNSELTEEDLNSWAQSAADGGGVFAKYLTVKRLTAEQIDTMFLNSEFNNLTYLNVGNPHNKPVRIEEGLDVGFIETYYPPKVQALGGTFHEYRVLDVAKDQNDENTLIITKMDDAGNIETINFRKAAPSEPLTATWSSRRFPLTISNDTDNIKIGFNSIYQTEKDINLGISIDPLTPPTVHEQTTSLLDIPYIITERQWDSEGGTFNDITRYTDGLLVGVDATPVYNNGWNAASDITALNPVIVSSQTTKDFRLVKPKKNDPGNSQIVGYYVDVDINYAYVKDPNDTVIAKVDNAAADRNRSSRIGNNVPNYYNVSDDEYDNAPNDHKFALTRYSSRYSVVTQYQKRDGTYANGDIYYVTTPADRYTDGRNDIINAGGPISQNGAVSNRAINKYVTTLTVTGINATGNISITNRQNASTEATLASSLGASSASALSNMFTSNPATYNQFYGIKVECPSASNTPQYYYFKTPVDRYDSGHSAGYNDGRNSITKSNIDVNSWSWYDSSASLPSSDATLSSMGNLIKKSKRGYVYFTVSVLNASKRYRIPINTA